METLENFKTGNLLYQSLNDLHTQSQNWLSEIEFWNTELNFFQKLLTKSVIKEVDRYDEIIASGLEGKIKKYKKEAIDQMKPEINKHEKYLAKLLKNEKQHKDKVYREVHLKLNMEMMELEKAFKNFKREIFSYVESLD